jgi:SAM-dependent methyltransferase
MKKKENNFVFLEDFDFLKDSKIDNVNCYIPSDVSFYEDRSIYVSNFSFPIICKEQLNILVNLFKNKTVLDIGAGTGFLSFLLKEKEIDCIPISLDKNNCSYFKNTKPYVDLVYFDATKIDYSDYQYFILSWPNYDNDFGEKIVNSLKKGSFLFYQGEGYGGCTGNNKMHDLLEEDYIYLSYISNYLNMYQINFYGIHDKWEVYFKK